ncbi:probable protein phosphatase 2C 25 [Corylus avellana]|uniref:probable protein phosphatase 2C 25 n=1 Tax=Corylus avellana TaxID=13451 RepID=UPI001E20B380|nr:probable protein phosphatase 2C 25 [Corylus avellana]
MSCAATVLNSPIFSPRVSSILCKSSTSCSSPRVLHGLPPTPSRSSSSSAPRPPSPSSSLPFSVRFDKQINGTSSNKKESLGSVGGAVSKRKRPAMLDIPLVPSGFDVDTPRGAERVVDVVDVEDDGYALYCKRGRRRMMEDRYSAVVDLHGDSRQAFFGVFDGHGGANAAEFAADNMGRYIMNQSKKISQEEIVEAVRDGYLTTDAEFMKKHSGGGTCCVTALIQEGNLVVSNAGDCRAVMSREGVAEALTSDHRPSREDEKERIETLGGYVDCYQGVWRVQGSLAVSRGIGDRHLKQWITAEPETRVLRIEPDCEFLILASDGLWDKVNNQEAVDAVRPLCMGVEKPMTAFACKRLAELAVIRGSIDDISVMIIQLGHF